MTNEQERPDDSEGGSHHAAAGNQSGAGVEPTSVADQSPATVTPSTSERVILLPPTARSLAIRTDFSDQATWNKLRLALVAVNDDEEPGSFLHILEDPVYHDLTAAEIVSSGRNDGDHGYVILLDRESMTCPEHPVLLLDLDEEPSRTFRVAAPHLSTVEANLLLANMDFADFADAAEGSDGVYWPE
ncbi:DUF6924 domain-containing protein [Streptomyces sp. NPDC098781]|uniref:DUF6924 domain-containing protein n=1 Tax=Streptomyces sp. NPDC098781 TaxID=3366097 RepID=UPI0037FCB118